MIYLAFQPGLLAHALSDPRVERGDDGFKLDFYIYVASGAGTDVVRRHADVRSAVFLFQGRERQGFTLLMRVACVCVDKG